MTFEGPAVFADGSLEQVAIERARRLVDAGGASSRKHFLDAYAEHLDALKRGRARR